MTYATILYDDADGVATITLNRPDKLNALNAEMHGEVRDALRAVAESGAIRALVLTGAGRAFCAGQDLGERVIDPSSAPPDLGATLDRLYNPLVRALRDLPLPVVCAVNGIAAGGGGNLALACDIVLVARSAQFIQAFCRIGLVPDAGGTFFLPRLVGLARAKGLALLGDALDADEAAAWGLIWRAVDDAALADETRALAGRLAQAPTQGLALTKQALNASPAHTLDQQLDLERDLQGAAGRTADYREGVAAFLEKRPPVFRGR